jgi:hypothetical protein
MCRVRCAVKEGLISSERVATIATSDGFREEVTVSSSMIDGSALHASVVAVDNSRTLIELPQEAASGKWRLWVDQSELL